MLSQCWESIKLLYHFSGNTFCPTSVKGAYLAGLWEMNLWLIKYRIISWIHINMIMAFHILNPTIYSNMHPYVSVYLNELQLTCQSACLYLYTSIHLSTHPHIQTTNEIVMQCIDFMLIKCWNEYWLVNYLIFISCDRILQSKEVVNLYNSKIISIKLLYHLRKICDAPSIGIYTLRLW